MNYNPEIKEQPARPALSIRTRTSVQALPEVVGQAYGKIAGYLAELGKVPAGAPFVAYYNMDMQDLDIEIGFPVAKPQEGKGEIRASQVPGGKLAFALHTGPYREIGPAYEALTQYVREQGCEPTGVSYEFYLNDPQETPPAELQTQVVFPLK